MIFLMAMTIRRIFLISMKMESDFPNRDDNKDKVLIKKRK